MAGLFSADLHIHGTYSGATSDKMVPDVIAQQAYLKGLTFVGSGDLLHPRWMELIQRNLKKVDEGTYEHSRYGTRFVPTVEVEDCRRVHHLIILPSFSTAKQLSEDFSKDSKDINLDGRPRVDLPPPEIVEISKSYDCLIGPSHAFTPWTSMYKEFDSIRDCYGDQTDKLNFLELGLSADTFMADRIRELRDIPFLSNSDAHSPWPNKLAREFNRFELSRPTSLELIKGLTGKGGISLNVGLDPRLGKYHMTACSRCYEQFSHVEAEMKNWRCNNCGGTIKKGVSDRVEELADFDFPRHPVFRPDYLRIAPLSEVIALAYGHSNDRTRTVRHTWNTLVKHFGNEISVLIDADISDIEEVSDPRVASIISAYRKQELDVHSGGGGHYGRVDVPAKAIETKRPEEQRTLADF